MGDDGRARDVTREGVAAGGPVARLRAAPAALVLALAAAVLLAGCGSASPAPGIGTGAGRGVAATGEATQAPAASPATASSRSGTPHTPKPTPTGAAAPGSSASGGATTVVFVDVGQGDATIVRSGSWTGLVDGGPPGSEPAIETALAKLGVSRLSAVVVSHMHADHTGGLSRIVSEWRPRTAYVAGTPTSALAAALRGAGTTVMQVRRGDTMRFGAARAEVLSPGSLSGDANGDSVVLRLHAAGKSFLLTGDCTGPNEAAVGIICARGPTVDVLKVAHHGSRYSTSASFLADARPKAAVISVGPNSYGHPTPATVGRLLAAGAHVYTTWKNGSITFTVSGAGALNVSFARSSAPVTSAAAAPVGVGTATSVASGGTTVYVTNTGECYHVAGCRYLASSRVKIALEDARRRYRPCGVCSPLL
jgi:competence protein ComEC